MSKQNNSFSGKHLLDKRVEKFADYVYATFDDDRTQGRMKSFGEYYYPAMVSVCTDVNSRFASEGFADSPDVYEYSKTSLLSEMEADFYQRRRIQGYRCIQESIAMYSPLGPVRRTTCCK